MKRVAIAVAALVVLSSVGLVLARSGRGASSDTVADSAPVEDDRVEPADPSVPSPESAAVAAVAMTGDVVTAGLISRRELIESFTTPDFAGELADLTSEQLTSMQLSLTESGRAGTELSVVEFPLRARTVAQETGVATVDVWSVLVITSDDEPVARQAWRTVTLELRLMAGRWLVDGWKSTDGPAPAAAPEGAVAAGGEVADRLQWSEVP